jgi:hypothetical protein
MIRSEFRRNHPCFYGTVKIFFVALGWRPLLRS